MDWHSQQIFYHIYSLGFCRCPEINPAALPSPDQEQIKPVPRLAKIRDYYDHFQQLGITTIYLGPIFESCTHGYDTINYFQIDRRLGSNELFIEIVNELHARHIKVIIDGCFHHVSRLFPPFVNLRENKSQSPFLDWFKEVNFNQNTVWQDGFSYQSYQQITELPVIDFNHPDIQAYFQKVNQYWLGEMNVDGWRLDVAYQFTPDQWRNFCLNSRQIKSDCFIYGELVEQNYAAYVNQDTFHSATNYQLYQNTWQSLDQQDFYQLADFIQYQKKNYPNLALINFSGNHDTNRLASQLYHQNLIPAYFALLFTLPDIPTIYYGDEILLTGLADRKNNFIRQAMPHIRTFNPSQNRHVNFIKQLAGLRQLVKPDLNQLTVIETKQRHILYQYLHRPDIYFFIHSYHYPVTGIILPVPNGRYRDLITKQIFTFDHRLPFHLTPGQPLILQKIV